MNTFTVLVTKEPAMPHDHWVAMCRRIYREVGFIATECLFEGFSQPYAKTLKACFVYDMESEFELNSAKEIARVLCEQYGHPISLIWYIEVRNEL